MFHIKLKLCGPLALVVNLFQYLHFDIIAFASQTYRVIWRYFCLRRCDKSDHIATRDVCCASCFLLSPFIRHSAYCYTTQQFYHTLLVLIHSAAYANPCPSFGLSTLYLRRLYTVLTFNSPHFRVNLNLKSLRSEQCLGF